MEPSYLTEAIRLATVSRARAEKRLGAYAASAFHALVRDFEAAADFTEVPELPVAVSVTNRVLLTYDIDGRLVLEVEPRSRQQMALQEWQRMHRFQLRTIRDKSKVIL